MNTTIFQTPVSGNVSRRALLFMPAPFAALIAAYSRTQEPDVPFRAEPGTGEEIRLAIFDAGGTRTGEERVESW